MGERIKNVWSAFFDDRVEAENLRIRSKLMMAIDKYIAENHLTQAKAADLMGTTQPRISNVVKGKIDKFTIDMLINMLASIGVTVDIRVPELLKEDVRQKHSPFTEGSSKLISSTSIRVSDDYYYQSGLQIPRGLPVQNSGSLDSEMGAYNECAAAA